MAEISAQSCVSLPARYSKAYLVVNCGLHLRSLHSMCFKANKQIIIPLFSLVINLFTLFALFNSSSMDS